MLTINAFTDMELQAIQKALSYYHIEVCDQLELNPKESPYWEWRKSQCEQLLNKVSDLLS